MQRKEKKKKKKSMSSAEEKDALTALVVAVMLKTSERIGNQESAANKHFGVTGMQKSHFKINGPTVSLSYIAKSGVQQNKTFTDATIAKALKRAIKNSPNKNVFTTTDGFQIKADRVNSFLKSYGVSGKSLRGFNANQFVIECLKREEPAEDEKKRKRQFNAAAKYAAKKVGHGASTIKKHYLLPELMEQFVEKGKLISLEQFAPGGQVMEMGGPPDLENSGKRSKFDAEKVKNELQHIISGKSKNSNEKTIQAARGFLRGKKESISRLKEDEFDKKPEAVTPNKAGRAQVKNYGIDIIEAKKGEASNVLLEQKYKHAKDSEFENGFTFQLLFILKSKIDQQKRFAVAYFGENEANRYEYATASNDLQELIDTLKEYDTQEAVIEVYNPATKEVAASVIYPQANTYTFESLLGLKNTGEKRHGELKGTNVFEFFDAAPGMATNDETPYWIKDTGIDAFISTDNAAEPNLIYISRIDAHDEGNGFGTKFIEKLKRFADENGYAGLFAYPENDKSRNFFIKNGFREELQDKSFLFYREASVNSSFSATQKNIDYLIEGLRDEYKNLGDGLEDYLSERRKIALQLLTTDYSFDSDGVLIGIESFPETITLYRIIDNEYANIKQECLGRFWTYSKEWVMSDEFQGNVGFEKSKKWFVVEALFSKEDIDFQETLEMLVRNVGEREIRLKDKCTKPISYKIIEYEKFRGTAYAPVPVLLKASELIKSTVYQLNQDRQALGDWSYEQSNEIEKKLQEVKGKMKGMRGKNPEKEKLQAQVDELNGQLETIGSQVETEMNLQVELTDEFLRGYIAENKLVPLSYFDSKKAQQKGIDEVIFEFWESIYERPGTEQYWDRTAEYVLLDILKDFKLNQEIKSGDDYSPPMEVSQVTGEKMPLPVVQLTDYLLGRTKGAKLLHAKFQTADTYGLMPSWQIAISTPPGVQLFDQQEINIIFDCSVYLKKVSDGFNETVKPFGNFLPESDELLKRAIKKIQWKANKEGYPPQKYGNQNIIVLTDEYIFNKYIKGHIRKGFGETFPEYRQKVGETYYSFIRKDNQGDWREDRMRSLEELMPPPEYFENGWALEVTDFQSPEAIKQGMAADSDEPGQQPETGSTYILALPYKVSPGDVRVASSMFGEVYISLVDYRLKLNSMLLRMLHAEDELFKETGSHENAAYVVVFEPGLYIAFHQSAKNIAKCTKAPVYHLDLPKQQEKEYLFFAEKVGSSVDYVLIPQEEFESLRCPELTKVKLDSDGVVNEPFHQKVFIPASHRAAQFEEKLSQLYRMIVSPTGYKASPDEFMNLTRDTIQDVWNYVKTHITKADVEQAKKEWMEYFGPDRKDIPEDQILGMSVNRAVGKITGGGEAEALLRLEDAVAKHLGYKFETQLDKLEKEGYPNKIPPLEQPPLETKSEGFPVRHVYGTTMSSIEQMAFDKYKSNNNIAMNTKTKEERHALAQEWLDKNREGSVSVSWQELLVQKPEGRKSVVNKGFALIKKGCVIGFKYDATSSGNVVEVLVQPQGEKYTFSEIEKFDTYAHARERAYELNNALLTPEQKELMEKYRQLFVEAFQYYYEYQEQTGGQNLVQAGYDYAIDKLQKVHALTDDQAAWIIDNIQYMGDGIPKNPESFTTHMVRAFVLEGASSEDERHGRTPAPKIKAKNSDDGFKLYKDHNSEWEARQKYNALSEDEKHGLTPIAVHSAAIDNLKISEVISENHEKLGEIDRFGNIKDFLTEQQNKDFFESNKSFDEYVAELYIAGKLTDADTKKVDFILSGKTLKVEINKDIAFKDLDASAQVRLLDSDDLFYKDGYRYDVRVSFPESLGEMGNYSEDNVFKEVPTMAEIRDAVVDTIQVEIARLGEEQYLGARDENILAALEKVKDKLVLSKKVEPTTPFDYSKLFEDAANQTVSEREPDIDLLREEAYQKGRWDKKWAPNYKAALEKLTKQYRVASVKKSEWDAKQYKQNKTIVEVGARDSDFGPALSIGAINEGRKQKTIRGAEMYMTEAIDGLKQLGLTEMEIEAITKN